VCPIPLDTITFLEKPLNAATLRAAVRRALQRDGGR
jgi:FixJ family two-component response regulator